MDDEGYDAVPSSSSSCISSPAATGDLIDANLTATPSDLGTLQNNGGPTETIEPNAGAPEIAAIPANTTVGGTTLCPQTDQTNASSGTAGCTIGALFVAPPTTTAAENATASYSASDQNVSLAATIDSTNGTVGQGTVTFTVKNSGTTVGSPVTSATVSGGSATATYVLPGGTAPADLTIDASYGGGSDFGASSDTTHTLDLGQGSQTITFNNPGTQTFGTSPTLSASATSGLSVALTSATTSVCSVSGTTLTFASTGTCTIVANQSGNTDWSAATQVQQSFSVANSGGGGTSPSATTTVLSSSANPATAGQSVTSTATVTGESPTGTVVFSDNGTTLGSANVTSATASYTTSSLSVGTHPITASYGGDTDNDASTSATLSETVNAAPTTTGSTPPGSTTTPGSTSPGSTTTPSNRTPVTLSSDTGKIHGARIDLRLTCAASTTCSMNVTLRVARLISGRRRKSYTYPVVAIETLKLAAGTASTLALRVTSFGKSVVARAKAAKHRFHVTLRLLVNGVIEVKPVYL